MFILVYLIIQLRFKYCYIFIINIKNNLKIYYFYLTYNIFIKLNYFKSRDLNSL